MSKSYQLSLYISWQWTEVTSYWFLLLLGPRSETVWRRYNFHAWRRFCHVFSLTLLPKELLAPNLCFEKRRIRFSFSESDSLNPIKQRFLTFFYFSTPFGHAWAVQHPLPLANTWLLWR